MRLLFALFVLSVGAASSRADEVIVTPRRSTVVVQSAQDAAIVLARRGSLVHTGCGQTEGIGFSTTSADAAIQRCCYWGRKTPTDIGVAYSHVRRGWFAVVRYR